MNTHDDCLSTYISHQSWFNLTTKSSGAMMQTRETCKQNQCNILTVISFKCIYSVSWLTLSLTSSQKNSTELKYEIWSYQTGEVDEWYCDKQKL